MSSRVVRLACVLVCTIFTWGSVAHGTEPFYKGKTIRLIYGFGPGGSYGTTSQLAARYLEKHIPGNPEVIAVSMPGAGGLRAVHFAYGKAANDGTDIIMPVDTLAVFETLYPNRTKYKSASFTWLGTLIQTSSVLVVRTDSGIERFEDILSRSVNVSATGVGSATFLVPKLTNGILKTKFRIVQGYVGSSEMLLAVTRGEVAGIFLNWASLKKQKGWFDSDPFARPILQLSANPEPDLTGVPTLRSLMKSEDDKTIVGLIETMSYVGRSIAVPPGVPDSRTRILRQAFRNMLQDQELHDEMAKAGFDLAPVAGEKVQEVIRNTFSISPQVVEKARQFLVE